MSIFGPIITGAQLEQAAMDTLQLWMPDYVAALERETGREPRSVPLPKAWVRRNDAVARWPENRVPAIALVSPGLSTDPVKDGEGNYSCAFELAVGAIVNARDQQSANDLAKLYAAAIRTLLLQRGDLGGFANGTVWTKEGYTDTPADYLKIGAIATVTFDVIVEGVAVDHGGPLAPSDDPYLDPGDWPTVATTALTLTPEALDDEEDD